MIDEVFDEWLAEEEGQPENEAGGQQGQPTIRRLGLTPLERRQQAFSTGHTCWDGLDG